MLVSVIMPTYNCGKFILQSLDSVIAQTVTDWEVQIVDDCSTDNTAEVLKPYLENATWLLRNFHLTESESRRGLCDLPAGYDWLE